MTRDNSDKTIRSISGLTTWPGPDESGLSNLKLTPGLRAPEQKWKTSTRLICLAWGFVLKNDFLLPNIRCMIAKIRKRNVEKNVPEVPLSKLRVTASAPNHQLGWCRNSTETIHRDRGDCFRLLHQGVEHVHLTIKIARCCFQCFGICKARMHTYMIIYALYVHYLFFMVHWFNRDLLSIG